MCNAGFSAEFEPLNLWFVETKMLIEEHVVLGKIRFCESPHCAPVLLRLLEEWIRKQTSGKHYTGGEVEKKMITVFNPHLLQPNFPQGMITDGVKECVSLSAPGPHVFVLVLQHSNFNVNDRHRVKYVLNLFSYQAMKHTIVLTTDDEPRGSTFASKNNSILGLLKECGGGHLKFNTISTGWRFDMFRRTKEILKKECKEFLICDVYGDEGDGSVDEDLSRSGGSVRGGLSNFFFLGNTVTRTDNFTQVFKQKVGDDPAPDIELMRGSTLGPESPSTHVSKLSALRSALFTCLCACENADFLIKLRGLPTHSMSGPEMVPADLEQLWGVIQQQSMEIMGLKQEMVGLRAEVTALRAETAGLRAECGALQSDLTTLQADYDDLAAAQIAPAEPIRLAHQPKISLPDKWDGSGARCDVFLTNLSLIFEFQPSRYPTDRSRIALLVSLLTGQAAEWATAVLKADGDSAHSYPAFTNQLRAAFQHPESEVEVDSRLYHLKQGERSVSRYTTEFRTLSVQTTWSDAALRTAYYEGLSIRLKDELAVRELPDTLEGMIQLALRVDQRMRHHPHRTNPVLHRHLPPHKDPGFTRHLRCRCALSSSTYRLRGPLNRSRGAHANRTHLPVSILVGHQRIVTTAFVDSGEAGNFIDQDFAAQLGIETEVLSQPLTITAIDGRPLNFSPVNRRTKEIHLIIGNHSEKIQLFITKITSPPVILGHPWLIAHDPFISWTNHKIVHWGATCQELCLRAPVGTCSGESEASDINLEEVPVPYRDLAEVFSKRSATQLPPHRPYDLAIDLVPGAVLPRGHLYSLSATEHQAMEEYVAEGLRAGTIRPSSSPAAAGFFFVKKKDGGLRPCVDYRGLNQITIKNRHPLPLTNTALDTLSGARFFTKLDLRSAYNLVRIREGDEWKTAFITPTGHYETLVMLFGLCNSPSVFQQFINDVLRDMLGRWCYAYLDDILIYSKTLEEHTQHVRAVLRRLLAHQLYCKLEKCAFHQHSTTFLGFVISPQGVAMDPQKLEAVRSWPLPSSLKQLQRFLGFANFYRRFIQGFSATAAPLTALTKPSHGAFHLTPEAIQAFKTLCHLFTTAPVLTHPNPDKPFVVEVDASDVGVGAVLSQRGPDGKLHPCSFFSRKFNPTQQRYGVGDHELLAIKWALEEWRHWLQGGGDPFTVWTDHQNLTVIRQTKQLNPRQARWALFFEHFNFQLSYRPGSKNSKADAISRQHQRDSTTTGRATLPPHVILAPLRWGLEERVRQSHSQNPPPPDTPTGRLFVPDTLRQEVLQWGHDSTLAGHPGVQRTITFIARAFWWRTLRRDVQLYVQACNTCARSKTNNTPSTGELQPLPIPKRPWSYISIDFVTGLPESLGKNTILTIVDRFSKAVHLVALTGLPSAKTTAELILEHVVRLHGFPKDIVSDRGPQFTAKFWQAFCRLIGTTSSLSSRFHPQTNGQTERANQQLERFLRCFAGEHQRSWARYLVWAELSNNIHTSSATNLSPFEVCYGYQPPVFEHQEPEVLGAVAPSISSTGRVTVRRSGLGFPGSSSWIQLSSRTTVVGYPPSRDRLVPVLEGGVLSHAPSHVRSRGPGSNFTQVFKQEVGDDPAPDIELMRGSTLGPESPSTHVSKLSALRSALFTCLCACENADFLVEISTPFWSVLRLNCVVYLLTLTTTGKAKLNIVLCGNDSTLKTSVSKIFRGKMSEPQKEMSKACWKREGMIHGRQISVIELPTLTRLSEEEMMRESFQCLSLCDPGVHVFILDTPVTLLTNEDKAEMEKVKEIFYSQEHFMVLFITELTVDKSVSDFVASTESQSVVSLYGSWHTVMGLQDQKNTEKILKILDVINSMETEPYSLQTYISAPEKRVIHELEKKLRVRDNEIKEEKIKTLVYSFDTESVKLNLVVCKSNRELRSFISNLILNQSERRPELSSECVRRDVELHGRLISLVELPALFNTQLSEEEVMRQTHRCVSLCHPGVHVFIIIIPDAPLTDEDKAEMEEIQKIFSSRINKHVMILIKQNSEHQTEKLNEETQSVIESFGRQHLFIGPNTQVSVLMEKLEQMVEENNGVCFSTETLVEAQMEKMLTF
ncbi:hypothetical protein M9458_054892 [Cirrhinus mrigala]|uniref:Gypsy retrotransposon integrase-like protein 1 n=1 Tax=Cirrhinus mrigala TaxID=683832 RepID=A0ABD0MLP7_CIRMR